MSVYRTLKLPGHNATDVITDALRTYVAAGTLSALSAQIVADG